MELKITPAPKKKRVVIVGGGPGGMEAARVAKLRGHEVILIEKTPVLGGKMNMAAIPPFKGELRKFLEFQKKQMKKLGIELEMKKEGGVESIRRHNPDAVVIAAGTQKRMLDLPGSEKLTMMDAEDALKGNGKVGKTVAVVGGGLVGCETAEYLADQGKKVTIVEMMNTLTIGMESVHSLYLPERLGRRGVSIVLGAKAVAAAPSGLIFSREEGKRELLPCDTIILAVTPKTNRELYDSLRGIVPEIYQVGDCVEPRRITDAVLEGFRAGLEI